MHKRKLVNKASASSSGKTAGDSIGHNGNDGETDVVLKKTTLTTTSTSSTTASASPSRTVHALMSKSSSRQSVKHVEGTSNSFFHAAILLAGVVCLGWAALYFTRTSTSSSYVVPPPVVKPPLSGSNLNISLHPSLDCVSPVRCDIIKKKKRVLGMFGFHHLCNHLLRFFFCSPLGLSPSLSLPRPLSLLSLSLSSSLFLSLKHTCGFASPAGVTPPKPEVSKPEIVVPPVVSVSPPPPSPPPPQAPTQVTPAPAPSSPPSPPASTAHSVPPVNVHAPPPQPQPQPQTQQTLTHVTSYLMGQLKLRLYFP